MMKYKTYDKYGIDIDKIDNLKSADYQTPSIYMLWLKNTQHDKFCTPSRLKMKV